MEIFPSFIAINLDENFELMNTLNKIIAATFTIMFLSATTSCGNKIDNYISDSEKLVEKWKDKTSGENPLSEDDKKELRDDLIDLGKAQKEIEADPDLVKEITPEQDKKVSDLTMDIAFIAMKAQ